MRPKPVRENSYLTAVRNSTGKYLQTRIWKVLGFKLISPEVHKYFLYKPTSENWFQRLSSNRSISNQFLSFVHQKLIIFVLLFFYFYFFLRLIICLCVLVMVRVQLFGCKVRCQLSRLQSFNIVTTLRTRSTKRRVWRCNRYGRMLVNTSQTSSNSTEIKPSAKSIIIPVTTS